MHAAFREKLCIIVHAASGERLCITVHAPSMLIVCELMCVENLKLLGDVKYDKLIKTVSCINYIIYSMNMDNKSLF